MKTTENEISIIKISERGAYLITDGIKQAWTRPSSRRDDGSWTEGAYQALKNSDVPYMSQEERKEAYIKKINEEKTRKQKPMYIIINNNCVITETDKCYKVATGKKMKSPYKRGAFINEYVYLPKSQIKMKDNVFEMPTWLFEANASSYVNIGEIKMEL
jgi:hypothetical protein